LNTAIKKAKLTSISRPFGGVLEAKFGNLSLPIFRWLAGYLSIAQAVAVIVGTVVGAGILGIPYVFAQSGFLTGLALLVLLGLANLVLMLFVGEIVSRTPTIYQIPGYVGLYLGPKAKLVQTIVLLFAISGALLAYMIAQGSILSALFGGADWMWSLAFYAVFAYLIVGGINTVKQVELWMVLGFILVILALFGLTQGQIDAVNLLMFDWRKMLLPYGVILFACYGLTSIPQAYEILNKNSYKKYFKQTIIYAGLIPLLLYALFALLVVGVMGDSTTSVATVGLGNALGPNVWAIGNIFAFLAMSTSFLALGWAAQQIYHRDLSLPNRLAFFVALVVPLLVWLVGVRDFIGVLGIIGAVGAGTTGILIVFTLWKARQKSQQKPVYSLPDWVVKYIGLVLVVLLIIGATSPFWHQLKEFPHLLLAYWTHWLA